MLVDEVFGGLCPLGEDDIVDALFGYLQATQIEICMENEISAGKLCQRERIGLLVPEAILRYSLLHKDGDTVDFYKMYIGPL